MLNLPAPFIPKFALKLLVQKCNLFTIPCTTSKSFNNISKAFLKPVLLTDINHKFEEELFVSICHYQQKVLFDLSLLAFHIRIMNGVIP